MSDLPRRAPASRPWVPPAQLGISESSPSISRAMWGGRGIRREARPAWALGHGRARTHCHDRDDEGDVVYDLEDGGGGHDEKHARIHVLWLRLV
eukprot:199860-Prorocentrum_minimum.AAC.1